MTTISEHFVLLTQISSALSQWDLKNLIFCCGDVLFEAAAEKIESGIDLFRTLKHHNKLEPGHYEYLRERLRAIGRVDLAKKLPSPIEAMIYRVPSNKRSFFLWGGYSQEDSNCHPLNLASPPPSPSKTVADCSPVDASFSFRGLLLKVAKELTSDDVSKLAYLFDDHLSLDKHRSSKAGDATKLLQDLEKVGAIDPSEPTMLVSSLHEIGRKDLANLLVSTLTPQSLLSSLDHPHQLLGIKISMLKSKQGCYSSQRKFIATLTKCDRSTYQKHLVDPLTKNVDISYDYHTMQHHSMDIFTSIRESRKLDQILTLTLPDIYDFSEVYFQTIYHYADCDSVKISTLRNLFQVSHDCYERFDEEIKTVQWNTKLQRYVKNEFTQRRTPLGTPALNAVKCIYEVCSELYGGSDIEAAMEKADQKLYMLEYSHYSWCRRKIMTQWLESILYLLVDKDDALKGENLYDPLLLREILLKIVSKYRDRVISSYDELSSIIGENLAERLTEKLHLEGISINNKTESNSLTSNNDSNAYVKSLGVPIYSYLLLLLHFSYFGSQNLNLSEIFSRLKRYHWNSISDKVSVTCLIRIVRNAMSANEVQVDKFRKKATELNALCAPVVDYIISSY